MSYTFTRRETITVIHNGQRKQVNCLLTIDMAQILAQLGPKAYSNLRRKSQTLKGAIKVVASDAPGMVRT